MPNFKAEMSDGEKVEVLGDDITSFNKKVLFNNKNVNQIKLEFANNIVIVDYIRHSINVNGQVNNFVIAKPVKPVCFKRVREALEMRSGNTKKVAFYAVGWEDVEKIGIESSNTKIVALDGHGLYKIVNKR
jgi:hypothetical protein